MIRGNTILNNIAKLDTFANMVKSNELLNAYVDKIINKNNKSIKYSNDFDYISLDLLYTSLQMMNGTENISKDDYAKLDKKELNYYLNKVKGINFFKEQVPQIKDEEQLINYLKKALSNGEYTCNHNSTIRFNNGLIVNADWLIDFANFLITSFNNNINLSLTALTYQFNTVSIPQIEFNIKNFIKNIKLYEYSVSRKDEKRLSFQDVKYIINALSSIEEYDFKQLQDINSQLSKNKYTLSVNKKNVNFSKEDKARLEKIINEEKDDNIINEFIKDTLKCHNSSSNISRRNLIDIYEILRSLSRAYCCNYTLEECRRLFDLKNKKHEILNALAIANFYVYYIYDQENLYKYFDYSLFRLGELHPLIIDYETPEYKNIINNLSRLNKKVVAINRHINKYLDEYKKQDDPKKYISDNCQSFSRNCSELEKNISEIKMLREELEEAKDINRHESNINKTKLKYIKEAIIKGKYTYDRIKNIMIFDCFNPKDYHHAFHLEITLNDFIEILLSDYNRNIRINFYQI